MNLARTFTYFAVVTMSLCMLTVTALYMAGAHINITASLPKGLYWKVDKPAEKGDLVTFSPPSSPVFMEAVARGYIHNTGFHNSPGSLIKRVVAAAGDKVSVRHDGITVNGVPLQNATVHTADSYGRPLSPALMDDYELAADEVFLYSDYTPSSFDSRYFGVQNWKHVKDVVRPVLIYVPSF